MSKLSICIPTYNRSAEVIRQLAFFTNEILMLNDVELIVSDNNSDEYHRAQLELYLTSNDLVKIYFQEENLGLIENSKFLLSRTNGEYVWFVGDDDILLNGIVKRALNIVNDNEDISYIFWNHNCFVADIENTVASFTLDSYDGRNEGVNVLIDIFNRYGTIMMFMSACIYRRRTLQRAIFDLSRPLRIEDFLYFSFYCSNTGHFFVENKVWIYNSFNGSSWSSRARMIFGIDIPMNIIGFSKLLGNVDLFKKALYTFYFKSRGNFLFMLLNARKDTRNKIINYLGLRSGLMLFIRSIFVTPVRILHRIGGWVK